MSNIDFITSLLFIIQLQSSTSEQHSLQDLINENEKQVLYLPPGVWEENISISKSVRIIGKGSTTIRGTVSIEGNDVQLDNVSIDSQSATSAALKISGKNHQMNKIKVLSKTQGVVLQNAYNVHFSNAEINTNLNNKGIVLYASNNNTFTNNTIKNTNDGFYLEHANNNTFRKNNIQNVHFGWHLMWSDQNNIRQNTIMNSRTGLMIMESNRVVAENNIIQNENITDNAVGIAVYESNKNEINTNVVSRMNSGLRLTDVTTSSVTANQFQSNSVGIELLGSSALVIKGNRLTNHLYDGYSDKMSTNNRITGNYYSNAQTFDATNDGTSDVSYVPQSVMLSLQRSHEGFVQYMFSPSFWTIERIFLDRKQQYFKDEKPLIENEMGVKKRKMAWWPLAFVLTPILLIRLKEKWI